MSSPHDVVIITGASRGFGRACAVAFARALASPPPPGAALTLALLGRDAAGLAATASEVAAAVPHARCVCHVADLSQLPSLSSVWSAVVAAVDGGGGSGARWCRAVLINNAASAGHVGLVRDDAAGGEGGLIAALEALTGALAFNVASPWALGALFAAELRARGGGVEGTVVNVSSLAAVAPFATMGSYSVCKAARDMLHRVLAEEERGGGGGAGAGAGADASADAGAGCTLRTLSYAPGPMDTALQAEFRAAPSLHGATRDFFNGMAAQGTWVDQAESAGVCAALVVGGGFASGEHVDFYDARKK
jgi:sepiapterin reductase